jgi:xylan 1,4-beta-xylosidase
LINFQGIHKPAFWAYKFLAMLGETELKNADESSYVCIDKSGGAQILLWDITHPTEGKVSNHEFFARRHPSVPNGKVAVQLKNLAPGNYHLTVRRIGDGANDPYGDYLDRGSPVDLSPEAVLELKSLSVGKPVSEEQISVAAGGDFKTTLLVRADDVYFVSLIRE